MKQSAPLACHNLSSSGDINGFDSSGNKHFDGAINDNDIDISLSLPKLTVRTSSGDINIEKGQ